MATITIDLSGKEKQIKPTKSHVQAEIADEKLTVTGLPNKHVLEYVARAYQDKILYVIHRPEKDWSYDSFELHIGPEKSLYEAKITRVDRLRDGGTTNI